MTPSAGPRLLQIPTILYVLCLGRVWMNPKWDLVGHCARN